MLSQNLSSKLQEHGQSLVETALVLPILVMLIAGVVEFSNFMITQNRVSSVARAAARFGVRGGEDEGMKLVAMNTITQTMPITADRWDIWSIRGQVNEAGDDFEYPPIINHIYGLGQTGKYTETVQSFPDNGGSLTDELLLLLQKDQNGSTDLLLASDMEFVAALVLFDSKFILGIDQLSELVEDAKTMRQLHIMRRTGIDIEQTDGCLGVFPIAIEESVQSASIATFPSPLEFDNPSPPVFQKFINNVPNQSLANANEGYIYRVYGGTNSQQFTWLKWNPAIANGPGVLTSSLYWPGNSHVYSGSPAPGYKNVDDASDITMQQQENVALNNSNGNWSGGTVATILQEHLNEKRTLRMPTWLAGNTDGSSYLTMNGYAVFRIHGFHMGGNASSSWLLLEFIRWDNSCGQKRS